MDKIAARTILEQLLQTVQSPPAIISLNEKRKASDPAHGNDPSGGPQAECDSVAAQTRKDTDYAVFDLETQRSAAEVGGWHRADQMGISCAVLFDSRRQTYLNFMEDQVDEFIERLFQYDMVVGFNIKRFDYVVLSGYAQIDFSRICTLDILEDVYNYLGYRLSLAHLAEVNLKSRKSADGLQALKWWQEGRIDEILKYCRQDVRITRDLYLYGQQHGYLLFRNKSEEILRIPVNW
jgi:DEAD/DEAH box helicase domain-containing protein